MQDQYKNKQIENFSVKSAYESGFATGFMEGVAQAQLQFQQALGIASDQIDIKTFDEHWQAFSNSNPDLQSFKFEN